MTTMMEMARDYERQADAQDQLIFGRGEAANDNVESGVDTAARDVAESIYDAIDVTREQTGQDVSGANVRDLSGNIAGQVHVATAEMTMDKRTVEAGDAEVTAHVSTHEGTHLQNIEKAGGVRIVDFRFEEALTETAASFADGQIMAYSEYMYILADVTVATGVRRRELVQMYKDGRNVELNELYERTYGGVEYRNAA